eukprot:CAMPEP_0117010444 /NCGR_PEP_ID=MMETSP0472-20121206/9202_1 /TAXON_ID=693140 ORGANISM="Tiarina fusus, Strain LIS" /NCGR_SAMPLE_ID=MMETSP0472 /ASSEMBLY_ACC=CAM_ASM_000603 /LENGTH=341 /DNA_ID=CAMNT_0004712975 /DNA_START=207 /DNA_END=1228 /DNA_ORIENTATION=-
MNRTKVLSQLCPKTENLYTGSPEMIACLYDAIRPSDWKPKISLQKVKTLVETVLTTLEVNGVEGWAKFITEVTASEPAAAELHENIIASLYYARQDNSIAALIFTFHLILTPSVSEKIYSIATQGEAESISRTVFDRFASSPGRMEVKDISKFLFTAQDIIPKSERDSLAPENVGKLMAQIVSDLHVPHFDPECFVTFLQSTRILQEAQIAVLDGRFNRCDAWGIEGSDVLCFLFGRRSMCLVRAMFDELDLNGSGEIEEDEMKEYLKVITKQTNEVVLENAYRNIMVESSDPDQRTLFMNFSSTGTISYSDFKRWIARYTNCDPRNFLEPFEKMFLFKYR